MFARLSSLTFLLYFFSSCGVPLPLQKDIVVKEVGTQRQFESSDPAFSSLIQKFQEEAKKTLSIEVFEIGDIPINFGETENEIFQGVCFIYPNNTKEIIIKKSWWDLANDSYKESLIFHELGHCRLDREHKDEIFTLDNGDEYKVSLMNSVIISSSDYNTFKTQYLHELFSGLSDDIINAFKALN